MASNSEYRTSEALLNPHQERNPAVENTNGSANLQSNLVHTKDSIVNSASSVMSSVSNHPTTQQAKDAVLNGPVGQAVQGQTAKTSSEFQDLANSRKIPDQPAATGQPLTQYHSMFYRLLSWKNPRATGLTFAACVAVIFTSRYLDILRYVFKGLYTILGVTALAELAGKVSLGNGFATQLRPRKYYTIRKESLERFLDDVEQLINFAVIEFQRIVFVENIWVTTAAFFASFASYWLIKWLPLWGLTLLGTSITYLAPLIYLSNKEFIDGHLDHAGNMINAQASQVRDLAAQHTNNAIQSTRSYAGEYSQKAQELINTTRDKVNTSTSNTSTGNKSSGNQYSANTSTGNTSTGNQYSANTPTGNTSTDNQYSANTPSHNTYSPNTSTGNTSTGNQYSANTPTHNTSSFQKDDFPAPPYTEPASSNGRTAEPQFAQ